MPADAPALDLTALPAISDLSIARARAAWRNLMWTLLPEALAGGAGQAQDAPLPDGQQAALLAMIRGFHATDVAQKAKDERAAAGQLVTELLASGPVAVLDRQEGDDRPAGRLDLAAELLNLEGAARLAFELLVTTLTDSETKHAARILAGRLGRHDADDVELLDDALSAAGFGAGLVRQLCAPGGLLRRIGAVEEAGVRSVRPSGPVLSYLNDGVDAPTELDLHRVAVNLPASALRVLADQRAAWIGVLDGALGSGRPVLLSGMPGFGGVALAALVAANNGVNWRAIHAAPLVDTLACKPSTLLPIAHAEARLTGSILVIAHVERLEQHFRENPDSLRRFVDSLVAIERPVALCWEGPVAPEIAAQLAIDAAMPHLDVPPVLPDEREALLAACLRDVGVEEDAAQELAVAGRSFSLGAEQVAAAVAHASQKAQLRAAKAVTAEIEVDNLVPTANEVRLACSTAMTNRLRMYGSRVTTTQTWDDLILPDEVTAQIKDLSRFAQVREKLFTEWGFGDKMSYGRALSAMFSGPSGTGKTMVAGLIAQDLGVELYRVDLSRVVSKYIGETEERLGRLFSEATQVGAALLFDEADSLFGKRTEIKSSHDRYANLEVNYLLQRLEEFEGLVILTTNFGTSIDEAFVRRLRFRVQFPFPSQPERTKMWEVMLPEKLPQDDDDPIDFDWLGENFELSGGHVRNAVLRAGMLAAHADAPLSMAMTYEAAAAEYRELGKLAPPNPYAEEEDW